MCVIWHLLFYSLIILYGIWKQVSVGTGYQFFVQKIKQAHSTYMQFKLNFGE